jgi:hypothetical protein
MAGIDFKAEMTLNYRENVWTPGENFDVWYFKAFGKFTDLWSTRQEFYQPESVAAEMFYAAESQSLVFSRVSDRFSGTLAKYYYENLQFDAMVLTATASRFGRTTVDSLVFRTVSIDKLIPNNKIPFVYNVNADLVSFLTDKAFLYRGVGHDMAMAKLFGEILAERQARLEEQ